MSIKAVLKYPGAIISKKVCTKCNPPAEKPSGEFDKFRHSPDGHKAWCKSCVKEYNRQYYAKNHESLLEYQNQYESEHREQAVECVRQWRKVNPGARKEEYSTYYANNVEKESERGKRYRERNPEKSRERGRKYYREHPEQFKPAYHNRRARKLQNGGTYTAQEWRTVCELYNFTCLCCKQQEPRIKLTPDHVILLSKGGTNDRENIQPLRISCNKRKHQKVIDYRLQEQRGTA